MDQQRAQQLVVGCMAATGIVTSSALLADDKAVGIKVMIGVGGSALLLSVGAMFAPDLAGQLAVLVLVTSAFVYGAPLWNSLSDLTAATPETPTRKKGKK